MFFFNFDKNNKKMYRNFEAYLLSWKNSNNRKPLIIRGARQVGKTYTVEKFAGEHFKHILKINLEQEKKLHNLFEQPKPQHIINELSALFNIPFIDGETLLFIDEIQFSTSAIAALRYFYEERPGLHVIAAGSLLDHTLNEMKYSMPVGRVEFAYMYPMSFTEFLTETGEKGVAEYIKNYQTHEKVSNTMHQHISELLRTYFFIGGMPEAVEYYIENRELSGVEKIHANLITSIEYDFAKYGTRKQQEFLADVLKYTATHIGQKVKYVQVNRNAHSSLLKDALLKLEMSRIIHLIRHTKSAEVPLTQKESMDIFKPVFMDIGLVNHIAHIQLMDITNLATAFEGALAEQFVMQELIANGQPYREQKLNYWIREAKNANAEIDCLIQIKNQIYPIEIKAGKRGTLKSLHVFLAEKNKTTGIRLNMDLPSEGKDLTAKVNLPEKEELTYNLYSLPLYFAGQLHRMSFNK